MRLVSVDAVELDTTGIRGDRRFYLVDDAGGLVNAKRATALAVQAAAENGRLSLRLPDDTTVEADVLLGERIETNFYGRPVTGRLVEGPWSEALSELAEAIRSRPDGAGRRRRRPRARRRGDARLDRVARCSRCGGG